MGGSKTVQKLVKGARTKVRKWLQYLALAVGLIALYVILLMAGAGNTARTVAGQCSEILFAA